MHCQYGQCEKKPAYKIRLAFWVYACTDHLEALHQAWPRAIVFDADAKESKEIGGVLPLAPVTTQSLLAYGRDRT